MEAVVGMRFEGKNKVQGCNLQTRVYYDEGYGRRR
jgi:hypothetical protein